MAYCVSVDLAIIIIIVVICYVQWVYGYWDRRKVIFVKPTFPFGTLTKLFTKKWYIGDIYEENYKYIRERGGRFGGVFIFTSPSLMITDTDLIKNVMTKNFHYFNDRGFYCNEKHDPLSAHLLNLVGDEWKSMRGKLTSAFTPAKIKMMFDTVLECSEQLLKALDDCAASEAPFDLDEMMACFTTDVIGSCAFGLECNSFKGTNCEFRQFGNDVMRPPMLKVLLLSLGEMNKKFANFMGITRTTPKIRKFFIDIVSKTIEYREKNNIRRTDFLQILIDLKKEEDVHLSMNQIAAQALLFFVAGFETSASTLTFCIYELAKNPHIQERLREEINAVLNEHDRITYDTVVDMPYLTQVIEEDLRKYPPAGVVARKCLKDYKVPGSNLLIKTGTKVLISIQGLHHDPEYFPDPEIYDPERFNEKNKKNMKPYTYLPFGEGPRNCIGAKFGTTQAKIGLVAMLRKFRFVLNAKTPKTLKPYYGTISLTFPKTVWVEVQRIA
ncbi:hypothetical protein FQA39_LY16824 [Lamprigera yunnana]|nr:hypothetical protein FQA39_LY16824 [Lamprigera yunnana]